MRARSHTHTHIHIHTHTDLSSDLSPLSITLVASMAINVVSLGNSSEPLTITLQNWQKLIFYDIIYFPICFSFCWISVLNKWNKRECLIAYRLTEPGCSNLPMNCTLWLAAKKFLQENIRLMPHSENILMLSHLLLSTYLLFLWHNNNKKNLQRDLFLSWLVKCLLYQCKMCRIKCAAERNASPRGRSVAGERGWNSRSID